MTQQRDIEVEEKPDGTVIIRIAGTVAIPVATKVPAPRRRSR